MSEKWYYVEAGERKGPVEYAFVQDLISQQSLGEEDYVWKKGFDNWVQLKNVSDFELPSEERTQMIDASILDEGAESLRALAGSEKSVFIKIGADRGAQEVEYGPYSIDILKKLFDENRINAKTLVFVKGMNDWSILADFEDFTDIFHDEPPVIEDIDRRASQRKPFVARMYIQNNKDVFVGICRDISIGGMQVLVDNFPGKENEKISINVHPDNTDYHFVASGKIVRLLEGGQGFSFRFINLSTESVSAINKYLDDV